jgi:hypothetical protein
MCQHGLAQSYLSLGRDGQFDGHVRISRKIGGM